MNPLPGQLDLTDLAILRALQGDGRLSNGEQIQQSIKHNRLSFRKQARYFSPCYFNGSLKGSVRDEVFREVA